MVDFFHSSVSFYFLRAVSVRMVRREKFVSRKLSPSRGDKFRELINIQYSSRLFFAFLPVNGVVIPM